jgi:hypothetical protein
MSNGSDVIVSVGSADTVNMQPGQANTVVIVPVPLPETPKAAPRAVPAGPNLAWEKAIGKRETMAALDRLPPGLDLGAGVDEPIQYDAARRLLLYRGFMCHGSYVYLRLLSEDLAYLAALDELYVRSASRETSHRGVGLLVSSLGAAAAGAAVALWFLVR